MEPQNMRPKLDTHPLAGWNPQHIFLHNKPHGLSNQPDVVQVATILALVCVWSAELQETKYNLLTPSPIPRTASIPSTVSDTNQL